MCGWPLRRSWADQGQRRTLVAPPGPGGAASCCFILGEANREQKGNESDDWDKRHEYAPSRRPPQIFREGNENKERPGRVEEHHGSIWFCVGKAAQDRSGDGSEQYGTSGHPRKRKKYGSITSLTCFLRLPIAESRHQKKYRAEEKRQRVSKGAHQGPHFRFRCPIRSGSFCSPAPRRRKAGRAFRRWEGMPGRMG